MARTDPQVNIRLPADLIERLEQSAASNQRAFKAEIVARLEQSLDGATVVLPTEMRQRIEAAAKRNSRDFGGELWRALDEAFPAGPSVHEFYEQWFGALDVARGETRREMLEEANAEAREYWPDRDIGFHLDGDVVKFSMSKRLTLKSAVFSSEDRAPEGPKRNKVTLTESFRPDDQLPPRKKK